MSKPPAVPLRKPEPANVRAWVVELDALPDSEYAERVAEAVMARPDEVDVDLVAALRTPHLVGKSLAAVRFHLDQANARMRRAEGDETRREWRRRQEHFKHSMGRERRLLEEVRKGVMAQRGVAPAAPNPRQRAYERLAEKYPEDFRRFLGDEKARVKRARKAARQEQRRARRR